MAGDCNHSALKRWVSDPEIKFTHSVIEVVRCNQCDQTFKPTVDSYNGDVYLREIDDPFEP